ncbi:MAG TPA: YggT family protein [Blastocatellia bacterium]|nr:YggT family protein [Blastocatellia bacterium]
MAILQVIASALNIAGETVFAISALAGFLLALRVILAWLGANPFGWVPYNLTRLTEPMVRPLRLPFSARGGRFDLVPLVAAVLVVMNGLFIMSILRQLARIIWFLGSDLLIGPRASVVVSESIRLVGWVLVVAIFLRFVLPYFGVSYRNKIMGITFKATEPILAPLRKALRRFVGAMGVFDFTALVGVLVVWIATEVLADAARQLLA